MRRKSLTREAVLDAAGNIIRDRGLKNCTIRTLAGDLNIAVGTLYNYYSSRDLLLHDLFHKSWNSTIQKISALSGEDLPSVQEAVKKLIQILRDDIKDRGGLGREVITTRSGFKDIRSELISAMDRLIQKNTLYGGTKSGLRAIWLLAIISDAFVYEEQIDDIYIEELAESLFNL